MGLSSDQKKILNEQLEKLFEDKNYDVLIGQCGGYGHIRGEMAAILAAKNQKIHVKTLVVHHACTHYPPFMGIFLKLINHRLFLHSY